MHPVDHAPAVEAAKRRKLARDLFPEPAARYLAYMPERYDADGKMIPPWTDSDENAFLQRIKDDNDVLAKYAEQYILSATGPAVDAVKLAGDICERRGWNFDIIPALAEELTDAIGGRGEWRDIETAPKDGRTILLGYFNAAGKWRTIRGQWMSEAYLAEYWEEPDDAEPGWYETTVECDEPPNCWRTSPTHWQPLPAAPTEPAK